MGHHICGPSTRQRLATQSPGDDALDETVFSQAGLDLSGPERAALDVLLARTASGPLHG